MSSTFGNVLHLSIFGQSHSPAIGCSLDGIPAGIAVDQEQLQAFLDRRADLAQFSGHRGQAVGFLHSPALDIANRRRSVGEQRGESVVLLVGEQVGACRQGAAGAVERVVLAASVPVTPCAWKRA